MEPRNIPHNSSISRDWDTYRSARVIGGCEFGVVRRKLWDDRDLYGRYFQKDCESSGHPQWGTCEGSHRLWPFRSRALVCARRSVSSQITGEQVANNAPLTGIWPSGISPLMF